MQNKRGKRAYEDKSTIARFDPRQNRWTKLGDLRVSRSRHRVIKVNNEFIVVGGDELTESCKLINGQSMTCTIREPKVGVEPELMLVSSSFIDQC